jgi:hypothetical protein
MKKVCGSIPSIPPPGLPGADDVALANTRVKSKHLVKKTLTESSFRGKSAAHFFSIFGQNYRL